MANSESLGECSETKMTSLNHMSNQDSGSISLPSDNVACDKDNKCQSLSQVDQLSDYGNSEEEFHSADEGEEDDEEGKQFSVLNETESDHVQFSDGLDLLDLNVEHSNDNVCHDNDIAQDSGDDENVEEIDTDLETRQKFEELLTEEEKDERKSQSQLLKDEGNTQFRERKYDEALGSYSEALDICPLSLLRERSILFSNRAACKMKQECFEDAIKDSTCALELHPVYLKALLRRAELYEKTEKLDEAMADYQKVLELDAYDGMARAACIRLPEQIKDRNEKMKEEMMGKLKDLGNLVLRPFGLSTNNFQLQQDPNSGSYSVQFQQNPPGNGS